LARKRELDLRLVRCFLSYRGVHDPEQTLTDSTILAMALELVIWFTDSIPGNAVCFALVGIFLGPCYPIVVMTVVDVIPPELQGGSIGWLASLGQGGSAIMPLYVFSFLAFLSIREKWS